MAQDRLMPPGMAAMELINESRKKVQDSEDRYAVHRAAEVEAWKGCENNGGQKAEVGSYFANIAGYIADLYHGDRTADQLA